MSMKFSVLLLPLVSFSITTSWLANASETNTQSSSQTPARCEFELVSFKADFESARLNDCEQLADGSYLLTTDAENRPINPSPWYAFTVNAKQGLVIKAPEVKQSENLISITIAAVNAKPRYLPKMQMPNGSWQVLDFSVTQAGMKFSLLLSDVPVKISAQPIINNSHYENWGNQFAAQGIFEKVPIGESTQGRSIFALVNKHKNNHEWLVLIGRQHPPEITGAMAMLSFAENINAATPQLSAFYDRFNVLIVPNINPDGVASGNWRHNIKGADLNRDWGKFEQVETKVVNTYLEALLRPTNSQTPKLVFALDFHSTQQDIFYTMPNDYSLAPADFSDKWLENVKANTVSSFVLRNRPGTSPGRGVFKQYIADTYHVHAITYEMGDNTPKVLIDHVAKISAAELIKHMLATPSADFEYSQTKDNN